MVWEVKTVHKRVQESETDCSSMDEGFELPKCNEDLPSSPGCPSTEGPIEYGDCVIDFSVFLFISQSVNAKRCIN